MTRTLLFSLGALLALGVGACGGDDEEDKAMMGTVNEASAKSTAMQSISATTTLTSSMDPNAGQAAANQYMAVAMGAQGIVTPAVPQAGTGAGTCTCEGTSCTFQDCGDDNGQVTMSGTISWTGGNVVMDIDYNVTQGVTTYELSVEGDITVTETSITGYLKSNGSLSGFE
ncbi:MAG: hypothetical protein KC416_17555, partial [Myxococcales bacterium]|nr:hypothetical protein [Myxococcales bacterium]